MTWVFSLAPTFLLHPGAPSFRNHTGVRKKDFLSSLQGKNVWVFNSNHLHKENLILQRVETICKSSNRYLDILYLRSNKLNDSQDSCDHWIHFGFSFSHRMHHSIDDPTLGRCGRCPCKWQIKSHNDWLVIYPNKSNVRASGGMSSKETASASKKVSEYFPK